MEGIISIQQAALKGKRVIVRADFDVTMRGNRILDDFRILCVLPTIRLILKKGGKVRIISHRGRPQGVKDSALGMKIIARFLERRLKRKIIFLPDILDKTAFDKYNDSPSIIFFENIRFWPEEEKNDKNFARKVSLWGDIYVNEAFANAHRDHACVTTLARLLPSYAGLGLEAEIANLSVLFHSPQKPFVAVLGGAKLETKLPLIHRFLSSADHVFLGGALANTLFALAGQRVGKSIVSNDYMKDKMKKILKHKKLCLPVDVVVASNLDGSSGYRVVRPDEVKDTEYIVDVGPETIALFSSIAKTAKTVVWNGPLGYVETPSFAKGTKTFAQFLSSLKAFKVVGGGDTLSVLRHYRMLTNFTHVSTGGGAMLEFLSGKKMPAIEVLRRSRPHVL
ncbi:MAG: phosphoglycerate kinase [Candidatus Sungbacteria bacterium]|nr:phosphoglycerate kinase [Candidatus Sungbacteria bacterium]